MIQKHFNYDFRFILTSYQLQKPLENAILTLAKTHCDKVHRDTGKTIPVKSVIEMYAKLITSAMNTKSI